MTIPIFKINIYI